MLHVRRPNNGSVKYVPKKSMEKTKIKRQALQLLKEETKTPIIGLKHHTRIPRINPNNTEIYKEFTEKDTTYVVWKQKQKQPRVAKKEDIDYVR